MKWDSLCVTLLKAPTVQLCQEPRSHTRVPPSFLDNDILYTVKWYYRKSLTSYLFLYLLLYIIPLNREMVKWVPLGRVSAAMVSHFGPCEGWPVSVCWAEWPSQNGTDRSDVIFSKVTNPSQGCSMLSKLMIILTLCCTEELAEVGENSTITEMDRNLHWGSGVYWGYEDQLLIPVVSQ